MMKVFFPKLPDKSPRWWLVMTSLSFIGVFILDLVTKRDFSFSLFYLIPIGLGSFILGSPWGYSFAVLSTLAWAEGTITGSRHFSSGISLVWTIGMRLANNLLFAWIIAKLRDRIQESQTQVLRLEAANAEKQLLLAELSHRVKNSLGSVVGLIEIEEALYDDPRTKGTLQRLQNRVESIAELYGLLSRSQDQSSIELSELVGKIAAHLAESFGAEQRGISLRVKLEELHIGSRPAMSLGIIVNEILTDCFKHAFPPGRAGSIVLTLCKTEPGARLEIMDDGIGLPAGFSLKNSPGFGMRLVGSLASDLGSSVEIGTGPGAHFILDIPAACLDVEKGLA